MDQLAFIFEAMITKQDFFICASHLIFFEHATVIQLFLLQWLARFIDFVSHFLDFVTFYGIDHFCYSDSVIFYISSDIFKILSRADSTIFAIMTQQFYLQWLSRFYIVSVIFNISSRAIVTQPFLLQCLSHFLDFVSHFEILFTRYSESAILL
jgi:hypothetical protein